MAGTLSLTDERAAFVESIRDFCRRETATREQRGPDPHNQDVYARMADLGWLGVSIDEAYGGTGGGLVDMCLLLEETAYGMAPVAGIGTTMIVAGAYERFGSEEQKDEILGGIVAGNVEAIAMSEPEAGSDVGAMTCRAEKVDGGWVVNGQKTWISNAHHAAHTLLIARSDRSGSKHEGLTMLNVPAGVRGLDVRGIDTMAGREVNDMFFTDCEVPAENASAPRARRGCS
jgi:isovaleryl-CoA dehydrogenase